MRQDLALELLKSGCRLNPEPVDQRFARSAVGLERLRLPSRAVQRQHQLRSEPFSQRVLRDELLQLAHQLAGSAGRQLRIDSLLQSGEPDLLEALDRRPRKRLEREVGERRPAPKAERLPQELGSALGCSVGERLLRLFAEALEGGQIELPGREPDDVPR